VIFYQVINYDYQDIFVWYLNKALATFYSRNSLSNVVAGNRNEFYLLTKNVMADINNRKVNAPAYGLQVNTPIQCALLMLLREHH